jgi:hypothetical protein
VPDSHAFWRNRAEQQQRREKSPSKGGVTPTFFGIRINDGFGAAVDVTDARNLKARSPGLRENSSFSLSAEIT